MSRLPLFENLVGGSTHLPSRKGGDEGAHCIRDIKIQWWINRLIMNAKYWLQKLEALCCCQNFRFNTIAFILLICGLLRSFKGCGCYIFTGLFCISAREHLWNKEKCFLFHFESSFHSWDNQILTFHVFSNLSYEVVKMPKHETWNLF